MTFTRIVREKWSGADGRINPSLLFDAPENLAAEGGSLKVGTRSLRDALLKWRQRSRLSFVTPDELLQAFVLSWRRDYNPYERNYGAIVGLMSERFRPVPLGPVLQ